MRWNVRNLWQRWIRRRSDDDFAAEVESHIALEAERLEKSGMRAEDVKAAARRAFGNTTIVRERFHEGRGGTTIESIAQDVRFGLRAMRRSPGFTAIAVTSLAIGIGANTTMFSTIDRLLVRAPSHVRDADRIHRVYFELPRAEGTTGPLGTQGYRVFAAIRDHVPAFESVAAFAAQEVSSGRGHEARPAAAVIASSTFFPLLGVSPAIGRFFAADEDRPERANVAVLGYDAWNAWYAGDSAVLGRPVDVAGVPHTIIGVAPNGFTGVDLDRVDLWLPIGAATRLYSPRALEMESSGYWLQIVAKRRASIAVPVATNQAALAYRDAWRNDRRYDERYSNALAILGPVVVARGPVASADAKASMWVAAVSVLVLLIACANVANLLLLRGLARTREVALRLSLGASRWRITRQWLIEGTLLAAAGAVCAIVLARWSASAMRAFLLPRAVSEPMFDGRFLAFATIIAVGSALLATVGPALVVARRDFGSLFGGGRVIGAESRLVVQRVLIGVQVALATLLLIGAGLFVTSLRNVQAIDLGVDVDRLLYVKVDLQTQAKRSPDQTARAAQAATHATYMAMLERVRQVPGVVNATVTAGEPLTSGWGIGIARRGPATPPEDAPVPFGRAVGPNYFETMGTRLVRGRFFTASDHLPTARVAIIDESTAHRLWPNADPLDPCVHLNFNTNRCTQIVGVVANTVLWQITGTRGEIVYVPLGTPAGDHEIGTMEVRTAGDPRELIPAIRQAVASVSPALPWADIRAVADYLDPQLRSWRLGASMFTAFGILALCLAAVGIYGLLSHIVAQRAFEIGVRKALGASNAGIARLVMRTGVAMTIVGLAVGVLSALGVGRLIASQLYGVSPRDPAIVALCVGALIVVAVAACLVPARRAARVDPMVALRAE